MAAAPVSPLVRNRYAHFCLLHLGRFADAIEQFRLALETDPVAVILHWGMAYSLYGAKRYREAVDYARRGVEIDANFPYNWATMGLAQTHEGLAQEAIASLQRFAALTPWQGKSGWWPAIAQHQAGDRASSEELARTLAKSHGQTYDAACYYAATGEVDAMFDALEGAYQQRERLLIHIKNERFFDPYHVDPRFHALLAKMNLA